MQILLKIIPHSYQATYVLGVLNADFIKDNPTQLPSYILCPWSFKCFGSVSVSAITTTDVTSTSEESGEIKIFDYKAARYFLYAV